MIRSSAIMMGVVAVATSSSVAQTAKKAGEAAPSFSSRTDNKDGSSSLTFGTALPTTVDARMGVDLGLTEPRESTSDPGKLLKPPNDRGSGAGWASVLFPTAPFGFTKTKVDARIDPTQEQGKFGVAVSRRIGDGFLVTLQNSYAVTGGIPIMPTAHDYSVETGRTLRFDVLSTNTAFSAGTKSSNLDDKQSRTISAEQQIVGPLSITGTLIEMPTGFVDKVLKAGFKKNW